MRVVDFDSTESYEPAGHTGVVNRLLAGIKTADLREVSVWHGTIGPGGGSDEHVHEGSVQIYVGLSGTLTITAPTGAALVRSYDAAIIEPGEPHAVTNAADAAATLLVISAPALR
jgi:quercetin dioxygenase-like cupin family protein